MEMKITGYSKIFRYCYLKGVVWFFVTRHHDMILEVMSVCVNIHGF